MTHFKAYEGQRWPKPGIRRRAKPSGPKIPEAEIQESAEKYLNLIGVDWFHLPQQVMNSAFRYRTMDGGELWAARNASARLKGFPDLILFYMGFYKAIELKSRDGVVSAHQWKWLKRLDGVECRSFDEFRQTVDEWKAKCEKMEAAK